MEKQVLTRDKIERDIANAIKNPPPKTQAEYRKLGVSDIVIVAVAIAAFVVGIFLPVIIIWSLLAAAALISVLLAVIYIRTALKIKRVRVSDYRAAYLTVQDTEQEHYKMASGGVWKRRREDVDTYTVYFEDGKSWRVPKRNYEWSECAMTDREIFESIKPSDRLLAFEEKATGRIAVAYHSDTFEYRS